MNKGWKQHPIKLQLYTIYLFSKLYKNGEHGKLSTDREVKTTTLATFFYELYSVLDDQ